MGEENVAGAFLRALRSRGVERWYVNSGTDFAPIVEAYAALERGAEDAYPRPVLAAHENLAMGMAHGAYLMTGEPQVVMFHVNVGTANAACAAINAAAERVPLVILAGRTPVFERDVLGSRNTRVSWAQEMYDQASLVREAVKWEYELRDGFQVDEVVDRAIQVATTEPKGPVYLTLPREVLARASEHVGRAASGSPTIPTPADPAGAAIEQLADRLAAAEMPVVSSIASGSEPSSVAALAALCERFAIGYVEEQARYVNLPDDHPMHLGHALAPVVKDADVLCFVESDVPWIPAFAEPRDDAFVAQCGLDPTFARMPMRSHRSDLTITSSPTRLFEALSAALERRPGTIDAGRGERIRARAAALRERRSSASRAELEKSGPITPGFVSATLAGLLHERCTVFNEYSTPRADLSFREPRSGFYLPATGGLGWALPAALGAKMAAPGRTMIATVGDGTYYFSNPAACHHASEKHGLPVLTIVLNNARWGAVDMTARLVYPDGHLSRLESLELADLRPSPAFEKYVEASNGHGECVRRREELAGALERAFRAVEGEKRQALVDVVLE